MRFSLSKVSIILITLGLSFVLMSCRQSPSPYLVSFDSQGGSEVPSIELLDTFVLPTQPHKDGFVFVGWYWTTQTSSLRFDATTFAAYDGPKEFTVYARWEVLNVPPLDHQITLINTMDQSQETLVVTAGELFEEPVVLPVEGYLFLGWFHDQTGQNPVDFSASIQADLTMYGLWQVVPTVFVEDIRLLNLPEHLYVNQIFTPTFHVTPLEADDRRLTLISSDPSIVSISQDQWHINEVGSVTISALSVDGKTQRHWSLTIARVGVSNAEHLAELDPNQVDKLYLIADVDELTLDKPMIIDLNGFTVNTLNIVTQAHGTVQLVGEGNIRHTLYIDAPQLQVISKVRVQGHTNIASISMNSFISEGPHQGVIQLNGPGRVHLSRLASSTPIHIHTSQRVVLDGRIDGVVSLRTEGANVQIDGHLKTLEGRINGHIHLRQGGTIERIQTPSGTLNISQENNSTLHAEGANVEVKEVVRVYVHNYALSMPLGYMVVEKGTTIQFLEAQPSRLGHDFLGWYQDTTFNTRFSLNTLIENDVSIYAHWRIHTFTVHFQGDAVNVPAQVINYQQRVSAPLTPVREGYRFIGWYQDIAHTELFFFSTPIEQSKTLYAKWEILSYRVRFSGTTLDTVEVNHGQQLNLPTSPLLEGHTFVGWYLDPSFTQLFSPWTSITQNLTLYPKFERNAYRVNFVTGVDGLDLEPQNILFNQTVSQPVLQREFYVLEGWYTDAQHQHRYAFSTPIQEDLTLYAKWLENPHLSAYPVYFMNLDLPMILVPVNQTLTLDEPTRQGYTFEGWFLDEQHQNPFELGTPIQSVTQLYAKFTVNQHVVYFDTGSESVTLASIQMAYGQHLQVPNMTRFGYRLVAWTHEGTPWVFETNTMPDHDLTLIAQWEAIDANIFVLELDETVGDLVTVTLWVRGKVDVNSYRVHVLYDHHVLNYNAHHNHLNNVVNPDEAGIIRFNYSSISSKITADQALISFTFLRLEQVKTRLDLEIIEAYALDSQYVIDAIDYVVESLDINP